MAFITTVVVSEIEIVKKNPSDGELSENDDLQEAYNKIYKIATKYAMNVDLGLRKIETLEHEKKNIILKLFDTNELITAIKIKNMSLIKKVKSLETKFFVATEQLDRTSTSKFDNMLNVQRFASDKTGLGFVESGLSFVVTPPKFFPTMSMPTSEVRVPKEKVPATRRIRVDLSETKPKKPTHSIGQK